MSGSTKTVVYDGPYDEVDLALPDGPVRVAKGGTVNVPAEIAENLLDQGIWVEPKKAGKAGKEG